MILVKIILTIIKTFLVKLKIKNKINYHKSNQIYKFHNKINFKLKLIQTKRCLI
jgi:hypothetical protein